MTSKLPIAISVPHASLAIPPELVGRVILTEEQIFNEADVYTDLIYDFKDRVMHWHAFPYARSIIDVNRHRGAGPPIREGDGIVKRLTSYGDPVYAEGDEPDEPLEHALIEKYWGDYHAKMREIAFDSRVKLVLDCHSMAAVTPSNWGDPIPRPRITASNSGDANGQPRSADIPLSAPLDLTRRVAGTFGEALSDIEDIVPTAKSYDTNNPFTGGPIVWTHGSEAQPWLMIELSRATYIGAQSGDSPLVPPDMERITMIRDKLWQAIVEIVETL